LEQKHSTGFDQPSKVADARNQGFQDLDGRLTGERLGLPLNDTSVGQTGWQLGCRVET